MIDYLSWPLAVAAGVPLSTLAAECFVGTKAAIKAPYVLPPPFTVLIPAHDEADGIAPVVRAVRAQLRPCDRVLVVADNCTDDTAAVAASCGAEVVERRDPSRRGKAYALAFGREALRANPTPLVIIVDADCLPTRGALPRLAAHAADRASVVQGCYVLTPQSDATALVRFSALAFMIKNLVRQRGLQRLGGGALLQGTGMAFPWAVFDAAPLETASLVEDLQLTLDLRLAGHRVRFDTATLFTSSASTQSATEGQRTRWEHGSIGAALEYIPRLIRAGMTGRPTLLMLAADLAVPPLALLAGLIAPVLLMLVILATLSGNPWPLLVLAMTGLFAVLSLVLAWHLHGRDILPPPIAKQLPRYVLWKLPIYRRLLNDRQTSWVRTSREP